jgi:hypothetical protein
MNHSTPLNLPAKLSVAALCLLGLLGGSLIVAHAGFETSPRRSSTSTFVPAPEAYFLAAVMYLMSCIALLALLRDRKTSVHATAVVFCGYIVAAWFTVQALTPN